MLIDILFMPNKQTIFPIDFNTPRYGFWKQALKKRKEHKAKMFITSPSRALKMKNFSNSTCYIIINITIKNTDTITIIHLSRIDLF